jgi:hypothetical protein
MGTFLTRLDAVPGEERARFTRSVGPLQLDWDGFVLLRLREHLLHEWDVTVALDPMATIPPDGTEAIIDHLGLIARFAGRPIGDTRTITVTTTAPDRSFLVALEADAITLAPTDPSDHPDLALPGEAFIRVVYGRLDQHHTPATVSDGGDALDRLRIIFRGL